MWYIWEHTLRCRGWGWLKNSLWESILSFHHVGSGPNSGLAANNVTYWAFSVAPELILVSHSFICFGELSASCLYVLSRKDPINLAAETKQTQQLKSGLWRKQRSRVRTKINHGRIQALPWVHGAGSESRSHSDFLSLFQVLASFPLSRWKQVFHAILSTLSLPGPSGNRSAPHYQWIQRGRTQSQTPPEEEINENIWIWTLEDTALLPSPAKSEGVSQAHLRQTLQQSTLCSTLCPAGPTPRLPLQLSPQAQSITLHSGRWKNKHILKME